MYYTGNNEDWRGQLTSYTAFKSCDKESGKQYVTEVSKLSKSLSKSSCFFFVFFFKDSLFTHNMSVLPLYNNILFCHRSEKWHVTWSCKQAAMF